VLLDHLMVQVADVEASLAFSLRTFAALGLREALRYPVGDSWAVGLSGKDGFPDLWLRPAGGTETRELHLALRAPDRAAVDAVHAAAVSAGVQVLHVPRLWPEYHPGYYGVFLRDLDGHDVEAVHHGS
jgi:catechol 2,3-dioxygenase-like lactoylglutathione lyase family enzyme